MTKSDRISIEHCSSSQLKKLLELATVSIDQDADRPIQITDIDQLDRLLTELFIDDSDSGGLILDMVTDRKASIEQLTGIKDIAKQLLGRAKSPTHRNAATVLYHAAVAAAFALHGVNISSQPIHSRWPLYQDLASSLSANTLGQLFQKAADRLLDREEK